MTSAQWIFIVFHKNQSSQSAHFGMTLDSNPAYFDMNLWQILEMPKPCHIDFSLDSLECRPGKQ